MTRRVIPLIMILALIAAACAQGAEETAAGPATQTLDVHVVDTYAKGEDPLEELVPGTGDVLVTEFYHFTPAVRRKLREPDRSGHGCEQPGLGGRQSAA